MVRIPRILVVEDERIVAEDIYRNLKTIGYDIAATVSSGLDALDKAEECKPDLVLMDIVIDGQMNGIETAKQVRDRLDLPVVYLTAYADKDTLEQAKLTEPYGYLLKPFDNRELQITIEMALYKHSMERRLREQRARLKTMQDSNPAGILVFDRETLTIVDANPTAVSLIGAKRDDILSSRCQDVLKFDFIRFCQDLREGAPKETADTLRRADGSTLPVYLHAVPLILDGRDHVLVSFIDLTERRRAEEALKESEERYRGLFETMAQGVLYFDSGRKIVSANRAAERILETSTEDLQGRTMFDPGWKAIREDGSAIAKEDHPVVVSFHTGKPSHDVLLGIVTPDGYRRWLLMDTVPIVDPQTRRVIKAFATFTDISVLKDAKSALQRRNEQLNSLHALARQVGGMLDLELLLDTALKEVGRLTDLSAGVINLYSPNRSEIELCVHNEASARLMESLRRLHEEKSSFRVSLLRGTTRWIPMDDLLGVTSNGSKSMKNGSRLHTLIVPIKVGNRVVGSFILYGTERIRPDERDLEFYASIGNHIGLAVKNARLFEETHRALERLRVAQDKLVETEKLASLGALTSNIVHEIGNPLAAISNSIQVLEKHVDLEDRLQELLDIMKWETDRLTRTIEQLREFARPRHLQFESVSPRDVVEKAIKVMNQDLNLIQDKRITTRFSQTLPDVRMDPDAIEQVVLNLVRNGLQAMDGGGVVEVRLTNVGKTPKRIRLQVRDDGTGISKADVPRIFEPYFSTKARGMGLGMSIVKQVVDAHGGSIRVKSEEGKGTCIIVDIPLERRIDG